MSSLIRASALLIALIVAPAVAHSQEDHRKTVRAGWRWTDEEEREASLFHSAGLAAKDYTVVITFAPAVATKVNYLTIDVVKDGKTRYSFRGHEWTVFDITGDRLTYIQFNPWIAASVSAEVVHVDLMTGQHVWRSKVIGQPELGAFHNLTRCSLDVGHETLRIKGFETWGRYVEYKSLATGETVKHEVLTDEDAKPDE